MANFLFSILYVAKLTINNAYSLFKSSIELARAAEPQLSPILVAALNKLEADNVAFGKEINKNQKSGLTGALKLLDKERDALFAEIRRVVTSYLKSSDAVKKAAANTLQLFLAPYWDALSLPWNTESDILVEAFGKYHAQSELSSAALTLGIDAQITSLETKNTAFKALYNDRTDETAARSKVSGTKLKPAAVASYIQFCTALEQAVNLTPTNDLILLFNKLDDLRKKSHLLEAGTKDTPPAEAAPAK